MSALRQQILSLGDARGGQPHYFPNQVRQSGVRIGASSKCNWPARLVARCLSRLDLGGPCAYPKAEFAIQLGIHSWLLNCQKMTPTQTKLSRRFRRTALVLLCLAVFALAAALFAHQLRPGDGRVAQSKARMERARQELLITIRATNATENFVRRIGLSNSPPAQAIHRMGDKLAGVAYRRDVMAQVEAATAQLVELLVAVATNTVARYDDFNRAQEAYAALTLAGIEDVLIRPHGRSRIVDGPASYELLTRSDLAVAAVAALETMQVSRVRTFGDHSVAIQAKQDLEAQGIRATVRHMKWPGQGDTPTRLYAVFVRCVDGDRAQSFFDEPRSTNAVHF